MNKTIKDAKSFLKKATQPERNFVEGFESKSSIKLPTIAIPISIELTSEEKSEIKKMLLENTPKGGVSEDELLNHTEQLANISGQIKSISAQSVLLHGERIKQAQEILKRYGEGTFTRWLMSTYGNRQTPYSMLRYYEFYKSAPKDARLIIESAPKKAMYTLAARKGDDSRKFDLIMEHGSSSKQSDLLLLIQSAFPTEIPDKPKPLNKSTIKAIEKLCFKIENHSKCITDDDRILIKKIIQRLESL